MALDAGHQERRAPKSSGRMSMSNGPLEIAGGQTFLLRKNKCHLAARQRLSFTFCFSFLARHVGRDWTVCYWGLAVSRPALMPKYCSSQTSRSSFNRHAKILEREREREDRSLWLYLYGIRVTDIGGKFLCDPVYVEIFCICFAFLGSICLTIAMGQLVLTDRHLEKIAFFGNSLLVSRVHT